MTAPTPATETATVIWWNGENGPYAVQVPAAEADAVAASVGGRIGIELDGHDTAVHADLVKHTPADVAKMVRSGSYGKNNPYKGENLG